MSEEKEIWRDIPGYKGLYQVSTLGNVRSLDRVVKTKNNRLVRLKSKLFTPSLSTNKYLVVNIQAKVFTVHRLVASTFLGLDISDTNSQVNHKNLNKLDNRVLNLEIVSHRENVIHYHKSTKPNSNCGTKFKKDCKKWEASISVDKKYYYLGSFDTQQEAKFIYDLYRYNAKMGGNLISYIQERNDYKYKMRGVSWNKNFKKWTVMHKGKYLGGFNSVMEARIARQAWLIENSLPIYS